ncbi:MULTISPECIES: SpoIIIAH-like family protein [Paraclostridium]|uniref:SpoIIIAH-like family protein n=2 Tax=Paraclostridium bifermentans TaxID=1490 RepID=A0A5P3XI00_PARBF|nr:MULTISPECIES: SpoIIIAH-like family protein [Paraclostridium]EQK45176.1 spoIIIAH-like family protein [[Clostridium] bifermentans ATCC 19299] [Paraclostridium bifermentans ATCC 19299]MBN8048378.1 SpoIIIAH-like family protein [Paraclostridium bifermentans]MBZ6005939.1 SpoIIIAH-like family protein [Paraclostridium bifermentans]MDU0296074.1 SpoIIIAH-like family protein [Paraclostridium sp. MRS3W1]NME08028.1 SpoIIIAH-like family protein [Paraclostridium bifermentans]
MKFNKSMFKSRGFVVMSLTLMLVVVGTVNYNLSKKSVLEASKEMEMYEDAQLSKNDDKKDSKKDVKVVDSKDTVVNEKAKETSKEIEKKMTSDKNMKKASYAVDMKMNREKQRNELTEDLNEIINNPSTSEETRKQASNMKLQLVKDQELEIKIEDLLGAKGFEDSLVYISEETVNVVVNKELQQKDAAKIFDLVANESKVNYDNIKLMSSNSK